MPGDERKISRMACASLVVLRLAIGWHLMYEGLWKLNTQKTSQPWTAEGYLKNATGPFRQQFRALTGDPDDLEWLDYDAMVRKWDDWFRAFVVHYPGTAEASAGGLSVADRLYLLLNGPEDYRAELEQLPDGVDLSRWKHAIRFDPQARRLIVTRQHLLPAERDAILELAPLIENPTAEQAAQAETIRKFRKALQEVYERQSRLSFKERLAALLKGDPDRAGIDQRRGQEVIEKRMGAIEEYKTLLARYEANLAKAKTAYQWDHLQRQWTELQQKRRDLVGPVQALEAELKHAAEALLSEQQLAAGPVPEPMTKQRMIDLQTMWGLTILGGLLIAGFGTRLAALGAAGLLTLFYLAVPPWPGTPPEVGPEHSFIVNKVLVEALACLTFVFLPSGRWFGVDALFAWLWSRRAR
uniref:DoxX family membrane protein n=1 Tax=Schlesneria paludicola TaxID=360056 RepID=A0A7C4LLN8_9PLAN